MPKGIPNKRYTGALKQMVVETMIDDKHSYMEVVCRFEVSCHKSVASWKRIYLTQGPEGLYVERRGRGSKGRPKTLPKGIEEDLLAEVQRLRTENAYLKNTSLGYGRRATPKQKAKVIQELKARTGFDNTFGNRSTAESNILLPS